MYFGTFGASVVGNLYYMSLVPWVAARFPPKYTNAFMSGTSFTSCFAVVVQFLQSPGYDPRFSPTIYFLIQLLPNVVSFGPIIYIQKFAKDKSKSLLVKKRESMCPR